MDDFKLQRLKSRVHQLIREHEAIIALSNLSRSRFGDQLRRATEEMANATSIKRLEILIDHERKTLDDLRRELGTTVENVVLLKTFENIKGIGAKVTTVAPGRNAVSIAKFVLTGWFPNLGQFLHNFDNLPNHAKVQIRDPAYPVASYEWIAVEVLLYEDMCALFNCAKEMQLASRGAGSSKRRGKAASALVRATFNAIIYFLEAYLNGIALDFYAENMKTINDDDKKLILEEDPVKQKRITVSLREKVLQYPRIILGVSHPPIQESNCPELALIIGTAKQIRDAVAHPSALRQPGEAFSKKELWLNVPNFDDLEKNVDSVVALVRKIEKTIGGDDNRVFWLRDRGPNGVFGGDVFS